MTSHLSRRGLIAAGAAAPALTLALPRAVAAGSAYFRHGVASGDPMPTSVVLWTRVTPNARSLPGSGVGPDVAVGWEVATDARFGNVIRRGTFRTGAARDHTVKIAVGNLAPSRWYFYRFHYAGGTSRVGRTRTAPAPGSSPGNLRFGVVSCANLQAGHFNAYAALARRTDLHAILHLGDYLYEYGPGEYGYGMSNKDIRSHVPGHEMLTLADYRRRHAQYKTDQDLQDLHARYPFIVTWDDHETANDAWSGGAENHQAGEGSYATRARNARYSYDEWMPVRMSGTAALRDGHRLYRRFQFGQLAELSMLDLRTYRTKQGTQLSTGDPDATITGDAQMTWLKNGLMPTGPQWKLVGNPVMIAPISFATLPEDISSLVGTLTGDILPPEGIAYNVDQWDGYVADRRKVYAHLRDHQTTDVVFLTGDIHSAWAAELPVDHGSYPLDARTVGVEFVCTSVTSNNLKDLTGSRALSPLVTTAIKAANLHVKYLNFDDHGYSVLDLTSKRAQMDWYVTGDRAVRQGTGTWTRSFRTEAGSSRLQAVKAPVA